jgi:hypothetical protein
MNYKAIFDEFKRNFKADTSKVECVDDIKGLRVDTGVVHKSSAASTPMKKKLSEAEFETLMKVPLLLMFEGCLTYDCCTCCM